MARTWHFLGRELGDHATTGCNRMVNIRRIDVDNCVKLEDAVRWYGGLPCSECRYREWELDNAAEQA